MFVRVPLNANVCQTRDIFYGLDAFTSETRLYQPNNELRSKIAFLSYIRSTENSPNILLLRTIYLIVTREEQAVDIKIRFHAITYSDYYAFSFQVLPLKLYNISRLKKLATVEERSVSVVHDYVFFNLMRCKVQEGQNFSTSNSFDFYTSSGSVFDAESDYVWYVHKKAIFVVIKLKKLQKSKFRKTKFF